MISAKVLSIDISDRDYIWIKVEYDIEGKKVINAYPMDFKNVIGKTSKEILDWVDVNINYQIDRYIEEEFKKKYNPKVIVDILQPLIGKEYSKESADLKINNLTVTAKPDGTFIEKV
jgi:hypothetical protein